jgi:nucleolar protein 15
MRKAEKRLIQRENERKRKLAEVGINYDFDAVSYVGCFFHIQIAVTYSPVSHRKRN